MVNHSRRICLPEALPPEENPKNRRRRFGYFLCGIADGAARKPSAALTQRARRSDLAHGHGSSDVDDVAAHVRTRRFSVSPVFRAFRSACVAERSDKTPSVGLDPSTGTGGRGSQSRTRRRSSARASTRRDRGLGDRRNDPRSHARPSRPNWAPQHMVGADTRHSRN